MFRQHLIHRSLNNTIDVALWDWMGWITGWGDSREHVLSCLSVSIGTGRINKERQITGTVKAMLKLCPP